MGTTQSTTTTTSTATTTVAVASTSYKVLPLGSTFDYKSDDPKFHFAYTVT
jgi:hypothetical protein